MAHEVLYTVISKVLKIVQTNEVISNDLGQRKCFNAKECKYDGLQISRQAHALQKKKQGNHLKQMNLSRHTMCLSAVFNNGGTEGERIIQGCKTKKNCLLFGEVLTRIIFYESTQERQDTGR